MQPYRLKHLYVLAITLALYFGIHSLPQLSNLYIDIFFRSIVFVVFFAPIVYISKITPDLTQIALDKIAFIKGKLIDRG